MGIPNLPSKLVAIPDPRTLDERADSLLNSARPPDDLDQAALLSTITNLDLISC